MTTGASTSSYTTHPARSRLRRYLPAALVVWLVLEVWLLSLVAGAANGFTVFLLLVATFVAGAAVIKRAGRRAFRDLDATLRHGAVPSGRRGGNGLTMLAGLLLMIPGMISDAAGLLLLIPPVQRLVSRRVERSVDRRLRRAGVGPLGDTFAWVRTDGPGGPGGKVVPGEVIRQEPEDGPDQQRPPLTR
ncbi:MULTISPECIES: FxsA family membrane protein [Streptomyces]|uniref:FxsA family protein n=1 Tax=Streptomyces thermoviolaceus subsp. thermoviolaceus TaxID=66860 RepID=A0ABX0YNZ2_STRTL|nr:MULTISPECIES: FxsA family membrane protein [Streptomyces]MCM3263840.1 FxsA family protein [Streptomyces thermoviolaceus]NJP12735.1 FxsA family protein [Streptomyces thermoviolaceus subsp. thermoviolaceus]RSS08771.1 FxsA family protein [Streptomyces sp. WAC00469]WTD50090.1 FxsA family protein [Streptomyces thermoviolaceus]GGV68602.1 membrane protein [Streptomyces thermoviolaceus subsp. apingens]